MSNNVNLCLDSDPSPAVIGLLIRKQPFLITFSPIGRDIGHLDIYRIRPAGALVITAS